MKKVTLFLLRFSILFMLSCPNTPKVEGETKLNVIWRAPTNLVDSPKPDLLIINNENLVYSGEKELTAISIENGDLIWRGEIEEERALYNWNEMLYDSKQQRIVSTHYDNVIVWNAINGQKLYELSDSTDGIDASRVGFHTLLNDGYAIVGSQTDIYVFNWDGTLRREYNIDWKSRSVTFNQNTFYTGQSNTVNGGLTQGRIRAFNAAMGDSLWTYQTDNGGFYEKIYVEDGVVYGGTRGNSPNSEVVALDAKTGAVVWQYITDNPLEYADYFLVTDEYVFTRGTGYAFALDKQTGERLWGFGWGSTTSVNLVYLEGYLYLSNRGAVYVLDAETGELLHTEPSPPGDGYIYKLGVSENKLFVQTGASIIAYQPWHLRE